MGPALLVPVKSFAAAKQRLIGALSPEQRSTLARWMADRVLDAAGSLEPVVVCDDDDVASWAHGRGAHVVFAPGTGLNGALEVALRHLAAQLCPHVVIAHSDLPLATDFSRVIVSGVATIVPDQRLDGTNVLALPADVLDRFEPAYGARSFESHRSRLMAAGVRVLMIPDAHLGLDVDTPTDLFNPLLHEVLPPWLPTSPANLPS